MLDNIAKGIALLLKHQQSQGFPDLLMGQLKQWVPFDNGTIMLYRPGLAPHVEYNDVPKSPNKINIQLFLSAAYLLDPVYQAGTEGMSSGFYSLKQLAPEGFRSSEYYRMYYRHVAIVDECGYLIQLGSGEFLNIALGRTALARFTKTEIKVLTDITPVVVEFCLNYWQSTQLQQQETQTLNLQMDTLLTHFASSLLTERECQVIKLILQGYSTKSLAREMGIALETAKFYRKKAYAKLGINSQGELFNLFIKALSCFDPECGSDPLQSLKS